MASEAEVIAYLKGSSKRTLTKILTEVFECKRHSFAGCRICNIKIHRSLVNKVKQCDNCGIIASHKEFVMCDSHDCIFQVCTKCEDEIMNFPVCPSCEYKVRECDYCRSAPKPFYHKSCNDPLTPKTPTEIENKSKGFDIFRMHSKSSKSPPKATKQNKVNVIITPRDRATKRDYGTEVTFASPRSEAVASKVKKSASGSDIPPLELERIETLISSSIPNECILQTVNVT